MMLFWDAVGPDPDASGIVTYEALSDSEDSIVQREVSLIEAGVLTPDEVRSNRGLPVN
ncbi:MAG: hypothetical protein VW271_05165 [Chloroflexota bacterium]